MRYLLLIFSAILLPFLSYATPSDSYTDLSHAGAFYLKPHYLINLYVEEVEGEESGSYPDWYIQNLLTGESISLENQGLSFLNRTVPLNQSSSLNDLRMALGDLSNLLISSSEVSPPELNLEVNSEQELVLVLDSEAGKFTEKTGDIEALLNYFPDNMKGKPFRLHESLTLKEEQSDNRDEDRPGPKGTHYLIRFLKASFMQAGHDLFAGLEIFERENSDLGVYYQGRSERLCVQRWIKLTRPASDLYNRAGYAFYKEKKFEQASRCFELSFDVFPGHPYAAYNLACTRSLAHDVPGALKWLTRAEKSWAQNRKTAGQLYQKVLKDQDFDQVRQNQEFTDYLKTLKTKAGI